VRRLIHRARAGFSVCADWRTVRAARFSVRAVGFTVRAAGFSVRTVGFSAHPAD